jgi:hypothetical protein
MTGEKEIEFERVRELKSWLNLRSHHSIFQKRLRKTKKSLTE